MRCLVEASWGIGDVLQSTPICRGLRLLGFEVDLFLNCGAKAADALAPLFTGDRAVRRVLTRASSIDFSRYDLGAVLFGDRRALRSMLPGLCADVGWRDILSEGMIEANLGPARDLGYDGPVPPSLAAADDTALAAHPPRTVAVHARGATQ